MPEVNTNWWMLKIDADGLTHLYDLGAAEAPEPQYIPDIEARLAWARDQWGVPADWMDADPTDEHGWDVGVGSAPPHPKLLARPEVRAETWDGYPGGNPPDWPTPGFPPPASGSGG